MRLHKSHMFLPCFALVPPRGLRPAKHWLGQTARICGAPRLCQDRYDRIKEGTFDLLIETERLDFRIALALKAT